MRREGGAGSYCGRREVGASIVREGKEGTVWMVLWEERSGKKKV
jgi:hypothetical protein